MKKTEKVRKDVHKNAKCVGLYIFFTWLLMLLIPSVVNYFIDKYDLIWNFPVYGMVPFGVAFIIGVAFFSGTNAREYFREKRNMSGSDFGVIFCVLLTVLGLAWMVCAIIITMLAEFDITSFTNLQSIFAAGEGIETYMVSWFMIPVFEEMFLRPMILNLLKGRGKIPAIVTAAALIGLMQPNFYSGVIACCIGLVYGYVALQYSPVWSMLMHMIVKCGVCVILPAMFGGTMGFDADGLSVMLFLVCSIVAVMKIYRNRTQVVEWYTSNTKKDHNYKPVFGTPLIVVFVVASLAVSVYTTLLM